MPEPIPLSSLRERLTILASSGRARPTVGFSLGAEGVDRRLGDALAREALHEIYAASGLHGPAADGFGLALALRAARPPLAWIVSDRGRRETGAPYGAGLHEWGLKVEDLLLVRAPHDAALLAAGEEALRSGAVGAVLMSGWGETDAFTLTASRRLALAAAQGGATAILARADARPRPSAAQTRWSVAAAPSRGLEARAPGRPAFRAALLRSRAGPATGAWIMEWDRERRAFIEPKTSGDLVSVPARGAAGARAA